MTGGNRMVTGRGWFHVLAVLIVAVWGLTFISTKKLIGAGLAAHEIFLLRFAMAYVGIWMVSPRRLWADGWRDELWLLAGGVCGGSFYFYTENSALGMTLATNVAFIVCSAPLITTILSLCIYKRKATRLLVFGSLMALLGVALVVYNGNFVLKLSPLGDCLSLMAAFSWAFYSLVMYKMGSKYDSVFVTRKVFFYGVLTILPVFAFHPWHFSPEGFSSPVVWANLLFLGVLASLVCYVLWNVVLKRLGAVCASNYIYLNPLFTSVGSAFFLGEHLTLVSGIGAFLILSGVYLAGRRSGGM